MAINLNDDSFDAKNFIIFGGGKAGIVENVSLSINKKKPEDKESSPEYQLVYTDKDGGKCNTSFWYITKDIGAWTIDEQTQSQGILLKHVLKTIYGNDFAIPSFNDEKELLDKSMALIRDGIKSNPQIRIFANYGTVKKPSAYIGARSWAPMMELMSVPMEETTLKVTTSDRLEPLKEDSPKMNKNSDGSEGLTLDAEEEW